MNIFGKAPSYCAYVLRCWEEDTWHDDGSRVQRFSLEDIHTGQRHAFTTVEALMRFVQTALTSERQDSTNGTG